ncbi:MAG: glutamyl-tRNA reductase, partial [Armatimonadetes bacterium]|nr:glutamyl-tRNA reductase [Armatimonadota bacterium]
DQEMVRQMMRSFTNKLLHPPLANLRKMSDSADPHTQLGFVRRLFGMDERGDRR